MIKLVLFLFLLVTCWPFALVALLLYPLIWLVLLPFRLIGIVVGGVFHLIEAIFLLPLRILRPHRYPRGIYRPRLGYGRTYPY